MKKLLVNPFEHYSEKKLSFFGLSILVLSSLLAFLLNARFDGIIDVHFVKEILWHEPLVDNVINTLILTFFLMIPAFFINRKTRIWDVFNVALLGRIPFYVLPLFNITNFISTVTDELFEKIDVSSGMMNENIETTTVLALLVFALLAIFALCLFAYLIFIGYKTAANAKSISSILLLIIAVLISEWISKIIIYNIN